MLGQMKRQLENSRCFRQGMEKDLEECAEARWLAKPVLDSRALPLDSDNVRLQGPGVMSFEKKHTISGKGSIRLDVPTDGCRRHPSVPFPVSWTVKMKKKQKETQDILSYHTQAAGCSDKARAKASGGRQPIEECGRTGL